MTLSAVALFLLVRPVFAYEFHFDSPDPNNPNRYNIRWGKQEGDADLVKCKHGQTVGYSLGVACFKKATNIKMSLVLGDDPSDAYIIDWGLIHVNLYRVVGIDDKENLVREDQPFMSLNIVSSEGEGVGKTYILGPLPDYIEWCDADILAVLVYQFPDEPPVGADTLGERMEMFIVLDAPKPPMDPAWVSVLRISCRWARGIATAEAAVEVLTRSLYQNGICYGPPSRDKLYIRNSTDEGETFYLKEFLKGEIAGLANDFANFLVCLVTSVGAYEMKVQRSYPFAESFKDGNGWRIFSREIDFAGALDPPPGRYDFDFAQFAIVGSKVWESGFAFILGGRTILAVGADREEHYKIALVFEFQRYQNGQIVERRDPRDPAGPWNPTPAGGFTPRVTAADLP